MVSTQKVPRAVARLIALFWLQRAGHHRRQLENVSSEEIDRLEQLFKEWSAANVHSRDIEMRHVEFVRLFRQREALLEAQRKAKKWMDRAKEPPKARLRRRRA